jgi:hypothetical protein
MVNKPSLIAIRISRLHLQPQQQQACSRCSTPFEPTRAGGSPADMRCSRLMVLHSHCVLRLHSPYRRASKQCCSLREKMLSEWTPVITYTALSVSKWEHIDTQWIAADRSEHKGNKQHYSNCCSRSYQKFLTHLNVPTSAARGDRTKSWSSPQNFIYI